jgi:SAM-dependent methyltransferase
MSRRKRALKHIDTKNQSGLEIGPLVSPIVTPGMGNIEYADHATTADLRHKYLKDPNIDESKIVDISYVLGEKSLPEAVGAETSFDYVIASHVIEHVPNLVGWLDDIYAVLNPGGVLSLMIPDKRFTFDIRRQCTTIIDVVDAHIQQLKKPSPRQVYDHFSNFLDVDCHQIWADGNTGTAQTARRNPKTGLDMAINSYTSDHYFDSHCWVFTPYSFFELLKDMTEAGLCKFEVIDFIDTRKNEIEFYVTLKKQAKTDTCNQQTILDSIPDLPSPVIKHGVEYFKQVRIPPEIPESNTMEETNPSITSRHKWLRNPFKH